MFVRENMSGEIRARQETVAFLCNATAALGLLVLGFPVTPAAIRAVLLGWILAVVGITRFMFGNVQIAGPCAQDICLKEKTRG